VQTVKIRPRTEAALSAPAPAAIDPLRVGTDHASDQTVKAAPRRWPGTLAKLSVTAVALWLLAGRIDVSGLGSALAAARPGPLLAAFVVYMVGQALSACRWLVISRKVGFDEGLPRMIRYYLIGMFFNLFGPATLGGDVVRAMYLGAASDRRVVALNTVVFDRLSGLAMLVALVVTAMIGFGRFGLPEPLFLLSAAAGVGLVVVWWFIPPLARLLLRPDNRLRWLIEQEIGPFWSDRRLLGEVCVLSIVFQVWQIFSVWLVVVAAGVDVPWQYCFVFHPLVSILGALPISLAGLGIREFGYVYFLADVGSVPEETALAFAILWLAILLASAFVGGLVFVAGGGSMAELRGRAAAGEQ